MPPKACETLLYPVVSHILRIVGLPGEYHNTAPSFRRKKKKKKTFPPKNCIPGPPHATVEGAHRFFVRRNLRLNGLCTSPPTEKNRNKQTTFSIFSFFLIFLQKKMNNNKKYYNTYYSHGRGKIQRKLFFFFIYFCF